ncbi:MAG: CHAT domain-containing protein [Cyanobacteria bacterium J06634_6]
MWPFWTLPFWFIFPSIADEPTVLASQEHLGLKSPWTESVDAQQNYKQSALPETSVSELLAAGDRALKEGDYEAAISSFETAIALIESVEAEPGSTTDAKGEALAGLGEAYMYTNAFDQAIPIFESAIAHFSPGMPVDEIDFATNEYGSILINLVYFLGQAHEYSAHFGTALGYYHQVLATENADLLSPQKRIDVLIRQGVVEGEIGQYSQAESTLQQVYILIEQLEETSTDYRDWQKADALAALGWVQEEQENFELAIEQYQSAVQLYQQTGVTYGETLAVSNLGAVYVKQGNYSAARTALNQALTLLDAEDVPYQRAVLLDSFGALHKAEGDVEAAWQAYRQAIALSQGSDKVGEITSLFNLGSLMEDQDQPELAILFYKQAIANIETIRQDLQQRDRAVQQIYTRRVEDFYRKLADLLLQQDRIPEALQVIELLKLQEVSTYLHSPAPNPSEATPPVEQFIEDTSTADNLLNTRVESIVAQTFNELPANTSFAAFLAFPEVEKLLAASSAPPVTTLPQANPSAFQLTAIEALQSTLAQQPVPTAALYPLILGDRLELILITPEGAPIHQVQSVSEATLTQTAGEMLQQLKAPVIEPTAEAQQLHQWLIQPIAATLREQNIENIIYLPDGVLRYIPLAALHDGQQWLATTYQSHNVTATAIDNLDDQEASLSPDRSVLAGAFTDASSDVEVQVGTERFPYAGLAAARAEINALAEIMPKTTTLIDQDFTPFNTLGAVEGHQIVHLATHAKFFPGQPESSFILFGDGSTVNMRDIGQWELPDVELVVFSACETAVSIEGDGKEILGLGFQIQQTGAEAAIASLWSVNDEATAALMAQFYTALSAGKTKAQALQYAQQQLMKTRRYAHPYNWSGFILIGNGT